MITASMQVRRICFAISASENIWASYCRHHHAARNSAMTQMMTGMTNVSTTMVGLKNAAMTALALQTSIRYKSGICFEKD
ncbi:hypothetical protein [Blastomonas sp. AAP53]|uniref:hypothetical protein n=1 Tax=Blastomonas sp. AAP53 TaxID=1248760 RepID=UPI001EE64594|nr:hypothetical protein [Blastomonas sp. AAP53]